MMDLRPYQRDAVDAVWNHIASSETNPAVVLPTGSGKTHVIAELCRDAVQKWNGRVVVLAHVKELLEQAAGKLRAVAPDLPVGVFANNWPAAESGGNGVTTFSNVIIDGQFFSAVDEGVMQMDPLLDEDGRPLPGSPVIDAGVNASVPAGVTTDLLGNPRFVDDPDTPDTGEGTAPLVDLGAIEFQPPVVANGGPDMDGSGCVDTNDLGMMLGSFGQSVQPNTGGDLTGDGVIDSSDLGVMLGWFGSGC